MSRHRTRGFAAARPVRRVPRSAIRRAALLQSYRVVSRGLRDVLMLADAAVAADDLPDAADLILGALDDLAPRLRRLATARKSA